MNRFLTTRTGIGAGLALSILVLIVAPSEVWAQDAGAGAREMRHFWHVFIAFALAWIVIFGWIVSIVRKLRRLEDRLQ